MANNSKRKAEAERDTDRLTLDVASMIYAQGCIRSPERRETFARTCIASAIAFVAVAEDEGLA